MNPVDAIVMALTPGSPFNQNGKVFRSTKALAQFAGVEQNEVLGMVAENLADRVTIRPSAKRPENGPLIALTEFVPVQEEQPNAPQVQIVAGNAVAPEDEVPAGQGVVMVQMDEDDVLDEDEEFDEED